MFLTHSGEIVNDAEDGWFRAEGPQWALVFAKVLLWGDAVSITVTHEHSQNVWLVSIDRFHSHHDFEVTPDRASILINTLQQAETLWKVRVTPQTTSLEFRE